MSLNNTSGMVMRKIANRFSEKKKPTRVEKPRQFADVAGAGLGYAADEGINYAITGEAPSFKPPSASDIGGGFSKVGAGFELGYNIAAGIVNDGLEFAKDVGNAIGDGVETGVSAGIEFTENLIDDPEKVGNDALAIGEDALKEGKKLGNDALEIGKEGLEWLGITKPELTEEEKESIGELKTGLFGGLESSGAALTTTDEGKETTTTTLEGALGNIFGSANTTTLEGALEGALGNIFGSVNTITNNTTTTTIIPSSKKGDDLDGAAPPKGLTATGEEFKVEELYSGAEALEYDPTTEQKPPTNGFVDDNKEKTPEELGLFAVGDFIQSKDLMKDIQDGNVKDIIYVYEKPTNEKLKEITDVAKNIFTSGGTTSNTSNTSNIPTTDLLNTIGALLINTTTNTTNSKAIESREKALVDANTKKETTSTALKEAENAVKQAQINYDKETGYYAKIKKMEILDESKKALTKATAEIEIAINEAEVASTNNEVAKAALDAKEKTENNALVLTSVAATIVYQNNEINKTSSDLTKTKSDLTKINNKVASLEDSISKLKSQFTAGKY